MGFGACRHFEENHNFLQQMFWHPVVTCNILRVLNVSKMFVVQSGNGVINYMFYDIHMFKMPCANVKCLHLGDGCVQHSGARIGLRRSKRTAPEAIASGCVPIAHLISYSAAMLRNRVQLRSPVSAGQ